jgi:hypothetical protein
MSALAGHTQLVRHMSDRATIEPDPPHQQAATMERQAGVSVGHEDLRAGGCLDTTHRIGGLHFVQAATRTVTNVPAEYI